MTTGRYLEDYQVGDVIETAGVTLTESQILDFALLYDPQPFHMDVEAAARGPFSGLIASGFQTMALSFRLLFDTGITAGAGLGGSGGEELRWLKPVRPGDTLRVRAEVREITQSRRGDRGTVRMAYTTINQRGEPVMTMILFHLVAMRGAGV
jgi:acyl dehydratase